MRLSRGGWLLLALSTALAFTYGSFARDWALQEAPVLARAALKASAVALLALLALIERGPKLLVAALVLGAIGDALLALGAPAMFLLGAAAFLIGHVLYAALFLRNGLGLGALIPSRIAAVAATIAAAAASTILLWPSDPANGAGNALYAAAITMMVVASFTLPLSCWLAMLGAVLFLVSDILLSIELSRQSTSPLLGQAGWFTYWLGQAGICLGALGLKLARRAA